MLLAFVCVASLAPAAEIVVPLEYFDASAIRFDPVEPEVAVDVIEPPFLPYGFAQIPLREGRPEGEWKLPELKARRPVHALVTLGDREHLLVFDADSADGFYSRLYFDANANRDLTDDAAIEMDRNIRIRLADGGEAAHFGDVKAEIVVDGASVPFLFSPEVYCWNDWSEVLAEGDVAEEITFHLRVACAWRGTAEIGGKTYRIALGDTNGNGRFGEAARFTEWDSPLDFLQVPTTGDTIYLTTEEKLGYRDALPFGDLLSLEGKLYRVKVALGERTMRLSPVEQGLLSLEFSAEPERIALIADGGPCATLFHPGRKAALPAGRWRVASYTVFKKDPQGDLWRLSAAATDKTPSVALESNSGATLRFGEPYRPVAQIPEPNRKAFLERKSEEVSIRFDVFGTADEVLTDLARVAGTKTEIKLSAKSVTRPAEPLYKIVKDDGEIVAKGRFEYG